MKKEEIKIKEPKHLKIMAEGGKKLAEVRNKLSLKIDEGVSAGDIEKEAEKLIKKSGGKASFKEVPGYSWATCVNVNRGVVHGVPHKSVIFQKGDVVSVDVGLLFKRFHTDTSFTVGVKPDSETKEFLETGKGVLDEAIKKAQKGNRIFDVSKTIQDSVESAGYSVIRSLVGHGIGESLHESPQIPCFVSGKRNESPIIPEGAVLAIEVMYTRGKSGVMLAGDGWTIETQDGKIAGLFEETVAVTDKGPKILTSLQNELI